MHRGIIRNVRPIADSLIYFLNENSTGNELVSYHSRDQKLYQTIIKSGDWAAFSWGKDQVLVQNRSILTDQVQTYDMKSLVSIPSYLWYPMLPDTAAVLPTNIVNDENRRVADVRKSRIERQNHMIDSRDARRL